MKKYKFKSVDISYLGHPNPDDKLGKMQADGWEFVSVTSITKQHWHKVPDEYGASTKYMGSYESVAWVFLFKKEIVGE